MSDFSQIRDRPGTCQMACLDRLDTCVTAAGYSSSDCYRAYSECGDDCDGIERPEDSIKET